MPLSETLAIAKMFDDVRRQSSGPEASKRPTPLTHTPRPHPSPAPLVHTPRLHPSLTPLAHTPRPHPSLTSIAHTPRPHPSHFLGHAHGMAGLLWTWSDWTSRCGTWRAVGLVYPWDVEDKGAALGKRQRQ